MPILNELQRLFEAQHMVMSDHEMMLLSADLADDPAFITIKEDTIRDIKKHPEKYIRKELLTYIKLLSHELLLANELRTFSSPKKHFENVRKAKVGRAYEGMELLHDIWEGDAKPLRAFFTVLKGNEEIHFQVDDIIPGDELLVSLYEHLEITAEIGKPCKDIDDVLKQDKLKARRRRMTR